MLRSTLLFVLLSFINFTQTAQAQSDSNQVDSLTISKVEKKEIRIKEKNEKKLSQIKTKQKAVLTEIKQKDSLGVTAGQLKKLEALNKEIEALEKRLAVPKINKDKLLTDLTKDSNTNPYLKEYAKYKKIKKPTSVEGAVKTTNTAVLKNKDINKTLKEVDKAKTIKTDSASLTTKAKEFGIAELNKQKEVQELKKELSLYV